jgi:hypothetical protein
MIEVATRKKCRKCGEFKLLQEFSKDNQKRDGLTTRCKECKKEYYQENIELYAERAKEYRQSEQGREAIYRGRTKHRSNINNVKFVPHSRKEILDRDKWTCQMCKCRVHDERVNDGYKANIDHIKPLVKGGDSEPGNLQVLCRNCNSIKYQKEDVRW